MPHALPLRELLDETLRVFRLASNDGLRVAPDEAVLLLDLFVVLWLAAAPGLAPGDRDDIGRTLHPSGPGDMDDPLMSARRLRASLVAASRESDGSSSPPPRMTAAIAHAAARALHLIYCRRGDRGALDRLISPFLPQLAGSLASERAAA